MTFWILDAEWNPIPTEDAITWGVWFETAHRTIAQDIDERQGGDPTVRVSTVFLGLDHNFGAGGPPILWESLVFGGPHDGLMRRYATREAALAGHQALCELVFNREATPPPPVSDRRYRPRRPIYLGARGRSAVASC